MSQAEHNTGDHATADTSVIGDSSRIAIAVVLSRITGLARIVVAASVLGATVLGDLFVAVNVLPLTLYDVFAGSAISSVLVPPLVRLLDRHGVARARRLAGVALGTIGAVMAGVALVAVLGRSVLAQALTAGVDGALAGDARSVAGLLLLLIVPQIVAYAVIGVLVSVQHARRRFLLPSVAPVVENVGLLITIGVAWWRYGTGFEVDSAPTELVLTLAIGSGLSVLAHLLVQLVGALRAIGPIRPTVAPRDPELVALVEPARASIGWSSMVAARQFALVVAAAWAGAGGVQALEMAMLVYFIPVAVIGRPIASAALPRLAGWSHDPARLLAGYRDSLRLAAWLAVPAGGAMILLARPLAEAIGQGRFDTPRSIELLAFALAGLGLGALGEALFEVARQTVMAIGVDGAETRRRGLVVSTRLRAATALIGIPAAVVLVDGPALLLVLGLVVSAGDLAALALVHRSLRRHRLWPDDGASHRIPIAAAAAVALIPAAAIDRLAAPDWSIGALALLLPGVLALFAAAAWLASNRGRGLASLAVGLRGDEDSPTAPDADPGSDTAEAATEKPVVDSPVIDSPVIESPAAGNTTTADGPARTGFRPAVLIAVYLVAMPFLAGLPRGSLVPFLRPSETLQLIVTGVAVGLAGIALIGQRRWRVDIQPLEWWLLAVVVTSSIMPLLWLMARGHNVGLDQAMATLPFLKYGALYLLVRGVVRHRTEIDGIAKASVLAASVLAFISIAQAVGVGPVIEILERFYVSSAEDVIAGGRGTTTIGSSIATGAYLSMSAGLALSLAWRSGRHRWLVVGAICTAGALASGQAGTLVALAVLLPTVAHRHGRLIQLARWTLPVAAIGAIGLSPVLTARLEALDAGSGLPISWLVRLNNVSELYLPALRAGGWLLGVTPDAIVVPPDVWRTSVYLESGYLWLLWVGGIPLLVSAVGLLIAIWRAAAPMRPGATPRRSIDSVHTVVRPTVAMMAMLSLIDPHLTLRAGADLFFVLVALGSVGRPMFVPTPSAPLRWRALFGADDGPAVRPHPSARLRLAEIPVGSTSDDSRRRPEARLALTAVGSGHEHAAVELALYRTGAQLRGIVGPITGNGTAEIALLWRSVALVGRSLRLAELRIDGADPTLIDSAPVTADEMRVAAGLARRLERERVAARGLAYRVRRHEPQPDGMIPPVRLEPTTSVPLVKRTLDLVIGGIALIAALPILAIVALLVRRSGPGPIVFRQVRIGAGGLPFQMAKFRTMYPDNDDASHRAQNRREILDGAEAVKDDHDPRITPVGGILRRLSLDELPQLANVVRGEMSLVGPRPSLLWESELFPPHLRRRLTTRPGLTGLWQVSGRADVSMHEMLELDLGYVEQMSVGLDLRCLAKTATSVLARDGAK